jgi:hypothetical protein
VKGVDSIRQFRPIFKFVAKTYVLRISPLAHRRIDRTQTTFIKGRALHEGVLALREIAHELRRKKLGGGRGLFVKLDFEKAYDRVDWDFPREVLHQKGFSPTIVHHLMQFVSGGQNTVDVNGEIAPFFRNARGCDKGTRCLLSSLTS